MVSFDKDKKELQFYKVKLPKKSTVYEESEMHQSYMQYVKYGLKWDLLNVLVPAINKELFGDPDKGDLWVEECEVEYDNVADYRNFEYYSAFLRFGGIGISDISRKFCIFKLPYMDEFGVVKREGKQYALISELVQDDDITYNKNELKIITEAGCYINLKGKTKRPVMSYRKKSIPAIQVLAALAEDEGIDSRQLYSKLVSKDALEALKNKDKFEYDIEYGPVEDTVVAYLKALKSDAYNLRRVRTNINDTLSLDRAIGKRLARKITLKSGEVIEAEEIVTANILKKIKRDQINEVYIENVPNMIGYYLAEPVMLYVVRRGTEMLSFIRERFTDVRGQYFNRDEDISDDPIVIPDGTQVTKGLLEAIAFNGHMDIKLVERIGSQKVETVPFEVAVVGNRCFKECDLGISDSEKYVYVSESGEISEPAEHLTAYDLLAMMAIFERLVKGYDHDVIANRDLGLRKKVNLANELFHRAFKAAVPEFVKMIKAKLGAIMNSDLQAFANPDRMETIFFSLANKWWSALYRRFKVVTRVELDNPVAFYSSFAKINSIIKDKNSVTRDQRGMSMGHYGRLCPYETPSGKTMGVVNNKADGCKIVNGIMKTSYYKVKHFKGKSYIDFNPIWMSVQEEEKYRIADIASLQFDEKTGTITSTERVLARIPSLDKLEKVTLSYIDVEQIELVNTDPNQTDGLPARTIPFQGADDAARVIFGIGMAKQAKGLLQSEIPIVGTTGFYDIPRKSTYYMICAEYDGIVADITTGSITMYYPEKNDYKTYEFTPSEFTKAAVIVRTPRVEVDQEVKAGDVLVESNFTKDGYMATGVNCIVAYIPKGFNYEDGIFACKRLAEKMTSYGSNIEEEKIPSKFRNSKIERLNKFVYKTKNSTLCTLKHLIGSEIGRSDVVSRNLKGFIVQTSVMYDPNTDKEKNLRFEAVSFDPLNFGDKEANRHGNKGVTPAIVENNAMPMFDNGEFTDICYNPMGVGSRMNIGQILECNLGLACYVLGIRCISDPFNGATEQEIKSLLKYAWDLANCEDPDIVTTNPDYAWLPDELHEFVTENIDSVQNWRGCFNEDGTAYLTNPRTGKKSETPVLVGINYVYKLVHMAAKKEHARGGFCTEPYIEKLSSPTKGSSNRGGQRFGYMELDALAAYGADSLMHEILNERGDNPVARNNMTAKALHKHKDYQLSETTSIRRSTEYFVNAFEALGVKQDFEGELPNNSRVECKDRKVYKRKTLLTAETSMESDSDEALSLRELADEVSSIL